MRVINKKATWYETPHRFFICPSRRRCEKSNIYHFFENQLKAASPPHPACLYLTCQKYLALACGLYIICRPGVRTESCRHCIHATSSTLLMCLLMISEYLRVLKWWSNMQFSLKPIFGPYLSPILQKGPENKVKTKCVFGRDRKWNLWKNDYESFNSISSGTRKEL